MDGSPLKLVTWNAAVLLRKQKNGIPPVSAKCWDETESTSDTIGETRPLTRQVPDMIINPGYLGLTRPKLKLPLERIQYIPPLPVSASRSPARSSRQSSRAPGSLPVLRNVLVSIWSRRPFLRNDATWIALVE